MMERSQNPETQAIDILDKAQRISSSALQEDEKEPALLYWACYNTTKHMNIDTRSA